jgi:hypothetical protein
LVDFTGRLERYMRHRYRDFSEKDLRTIKKAVQDANGALIKAYADLTNAQYNTINVSPLETCFVRWFGPYNTVNVAVVKAVVGALRNAVCVGKLDIKSCHLNEDINPGGAPDIACPPGENASAWSSAGIQGFAASRDRVNFQNGILICPRMMNQMAQRGTRQQNISGTLVHELSHAVGGTWDVQHLGATVYGADAAKALAANPAGATGPVGAAATALNNAENYGFFCMEFLKIQR